MTKHTKRKNNNNNNNNVDSHNNNNPFSHHLGFDVGKIKGQSPSRSSSLFHHQHFGIFHQCRHPNDNNAVIAGHMVTRVADGLL